MPGTAISANSLKLLDHRAANKTCGVQRSAKTEHSSSFSL
jgi:hypothetical protein